MFFYHFYTLINIYIYIIYIPTYSTSYVMYYFYVQTPYILNMFPPSRTIVHLPIMSPIMTPSIIGYKSATNSEQYVEWVIIYIKKGPRRRNATRVAANMFKLHITQLCNAPCNITNHSHTYTTFISI